MLVRNRAVEAIPPHAWATLRVRWVWKRPRRLTRDIRHSVQITDLFANTRKIRRVNFSASGPIFSVGSVSITSVEKVSSLGDAIERKVASILKAEATVQRSSRFGTLESRSQDGKWELGIATEWHRPDARSRSSVTRSAASRAYRLQGQGPPRCATFCEEP